MKNWIFQHAALPSTRQEKRAELEKVEAQLAQARISRRIDAEVYGLSPSGEYSEHIYDVYADELAALLGVSRTRHYPPNEDAQVAAGVRKKRESRRELEEEFRRDREALKREEQIKEEVKQAKPPKPVTLDGPLSYPDVPASRWSKCDPKLKEAVGWLYTYVPNMKKAIDAIVGSGVPVTLEFGDTGKAAAWAKRNEKIIRFDRQFQKDTPRCLAPVMAHEWRHLTSTRPRGDMKEHIIQAFREEMECEKVCAIAWKILKRPKDAGGIVGINNRALNAVEGGEGKLREHVIMNDQWQEQILGEAI